MGRRAGSQRGTAVIAADDGYRRGTLGGMAGRGRRPSGQRGRGVAGGGREAIVVEAVCLRRRGRPRSPRVASAHGLRFAPSDRCRRRRLFRAPGVGAEGAACTRPLRRCVPLRNARARRRPSDRRGAIGSRRVGGHPGGRRAARRRARARSTEAWPPNPVERAGTADRSGHCFALQDPRPPPRLRGHADLGVGQRSPAGRPGICFRGGTTSSPGMGARRGVLPRDGRPIRAPGRDDATALYGGTLDGIREHIEHIAALGCNVLWLSPVHQSPSHHGYDHEDFLTVEPRYGGDAALVRLVEAAHDRDMRVLLDFVPNHTGRGHHLFRDAIEKDGDAASYYRSWHSPHYYPCFSDVISLPELDTGDSNVQQQLVRAAQHWMTAYGADGVRCDHVAGVDPAFWVELRRGLRTIKADALVLGEATGLPEWLARYTGRLDAIFDFDLAYYVRQALARGRMDAAGFATWLDEHDHAYPGLALATLMDNHDMNRFLWMAGGNADRLKLAATLLLTLPGMPVIYYGTEVGLSQRFDGVVENAEARLSMLWGGEQNQDLLAHFQALGRIRRESVALRRGERRTVLADAEVFAYERRAGDESVVVALNFSESPQRRELPGLEEPFELGPLGSAVVPMEASTIRS